jgi:hypothetical protein
MATNTTQINLQPLTKTRMLVPIVGTAPLIVHKWSEKAKRQMLDAQQGKKKAKEIRDPQADYEASLYHTADGGFGFPVIAFKAATIRGAKLANIKMTDARQMFFVHGDSSDDKTQELAPIAGEPRMREDMVRVGMGTDLRYRGEFLTWTTVLSVEFYDTFIDQGSLLNLIEFGGESVGVGEWRPEKNGQNGTYRIDTDAEIQVM